MRRIISVIFIFLLIPAVLFSRDKSDWEGGVPEGCTSITAGRNATVDGSVITSHTDDSHKTRSWMDIRPAERHGRNEKVTMFRRESDDSLAMPAYKHVPIGSIPQIEKTYGYLNTAYPCINEKQLAIGESTFGGRSELQSDECLIDCQRLCMLMLQRASSAREAIRIADELTSKYGWSDAGECLTISDKREVWHFEIVGPGKGKIGAVWAAQRVPDDHVSVNANASRIREIDLDDPDHFMASDNIYSVAEENGWWSEGETFEFCYAYAPDSRKSIAGRRREWRVFDLLAPSLNLSPTSENYPFSVKPDEKVSVQDIIAVFQDYYEGTPYDMTRKITVRDKDGKEVVSPLANPFLPYDQLEIDDIPGSWFQVSDEGDIRFLGERTIARWYTMYGTIIQTREWLPDEIGGVVWLAMDNIATSVYIPVYCGAEDLPESYKTPGRPDGYTRKSAWWAFNRLGTLTAQRWGDMRHDVRNCWDPVQKKLFADQEEFEKKALMIKNKRRRREFLTDYTLRQGKRVVEKAWNLGDLLWTKYDEKF
ncbi:MAG: C69 family dipeptidase [Candidatus Krumholzibacteriota bacterium]|nr:C69 family dipeptidase [Candidatus Krumholzibacteriota bacterium]